MPTIVGSCSVIDHSVRQFAGLNSAGFAMSCRQFAGLNHVGLGWRRWLRGVRPSPLDDEGSTPRKFLRGENRLHILRFHVAIFTF